MEKESHCEYAISRFNQEAEREVATKPSSKVIRNQCTVRWVLKVRVRIVVVIAFVYQLLCNLQHIHNKG